MLGQSMSGQSLFEKICDVDSEEIEKNYVL